VLGKAINVSKANARTDNLTSKHGNRTVKSIAVIKEILACFCHAYYKNKTHKLIGIKIDSPKEKTSMPSF